VALGKTMKILVLLFVATLGFSGVAPLKLNRFEKTIQNMVLRDWPNAVRVEVKNLSTQEVAPETAAITQLHPRPSLGLVSFNLEWQEKGSSRLVRGTAQIRVFQKVAVASKNINHGDFLSEDSVDFKEMELNRFQRTGVFSSWEELDGKIAKGFLRSGNVITQNQVDRPVEIRHGQMVELQIEQGQVVITAKMKALESGRSGQWIRVENPTSKKVVRAKIVAMGQVALR